MKYYVSVGRGGVFFRIGMAVTGMMGSLVYWRASRLRCALRPTEVPSPMAHPGPVVGWPEDYRAMAADSSRGGSASREAAMAGIDR